jgi:hypothetical protein
VKERHLASTTTTAGRDANEGSMQTSAWAKVRIPPNGRTILVMDLDKHGAFFSSIHWTADAPAKLVAVDEAVRR